MSESEEEGVRVVINVELFIQTFFLSVEKRNGETLRGTLSTAKRNTELQWYI